MQKIGRDRTREVKSFVSFVKVYRRPYPHHVHQTPVPER
jgi:hypothetical protein